MSLRLDSTIASIVPGALPSALPGSGAGKSQEGTFASVMNAAVDAVEKSSGDAAAAANKFLGGDTSIDIHTVAIAGQRAEISMELFQQVRNKVISAYQEIMRSQL